MKINIFVTYKEVERKILESSLEIKKLSIELEKLKNMGGPRDVQAQQYDSVHSPRKVIPIEAFFNKIVELRETIRNLQVYHDGLVQFKIQIEDSMKEHISKFNDVEMQVFVKHHIERKKLYEVADELGYDYNYIRQINSGIKTSNIF